MLTSWLCGFSGDVFAQFQTPIELASDVDGEYAMGIDQFGIVQLAYRKQDSLKLRSWSSEIDVEIDISDNGISPDLAFFATGFHLAYATEHLGGSCVESRTRIGQALGNPEVLVSSQSPLAAPVVRLHERRLVTAWHEEADGETRVFVDGPDFPKTDLGQGSTPALEIDEFGRVHVIYVRGGSLYHCTNAGRDRSRFSRPKLIALGAGAVGSRPTTGILDGRILYVAYERQGDLFVANNSTGDFEPQRLAVSGVSEPHMKITPSGLIAITYVHEGDVWYVLGNAFFFGPPQPVTRTEAIEQTPRADADGFANVFITFVRDSQLFVTTDAGQPQALFRSDIQRGEVPLEVQFTDRSQGDITAWSWDFGDGTTSTQQSPLHLFEETGEFTVRLQVAGPGGMSPLLYEETILVTAPGSRMWVGDARAFPGLDVIVPILGTHDRPAQGYQIAARFDPDSIEIDDIDFVSSNIGALDAELRLFKISNDPDEPFVTIGVLLDVEPPFDRRVLGPGNGQRLANLVGHISEFARPGSQSEVTLTNDIGRPPINNIYVVSAGSVVPELGKSGTVHVEALTFPPPRFFVRGDTDDSGRVTISDAILTLNYLFVGGPAPDCLDSADANDSGQLDLTDAAYLLNFLFRAGAYIAAPYPDRGLDPTEDSIPSCTI